MPYIPPHEIFDSVKKALMFLDEEGLGGSPRAHICNTAYQMALSMRNVEEAKSFANEGYIQYLLATGSTSRWTKQLLDRVEKPTVHMMWNPLRSTVSLLICLIFDSSNSCSFPLLRTCRMVTNLMRFIISTQAKAIRHATKSTGALLQKSSTLRSFGDDRHFMFEIERATWQLFHSVSTTPLSITSRTSL